MAQKTFKDDYESIGVFLILELLALVGFGLGGVNLIFQYAGFVVAIIATLFAFKNYSKEDLVPILTIGIPLFVIALFTSFGHFFDDYLTLVARIGAFLGILSFFAVGLSARRMKSFNIKNALYCLGGGLALITLISTIITWSQYGWFYPLIHKNAGSYYYDGNLYSILKEMSWLNGFKVSEVAQNYGGLFALLCAAFLPALLFIDYKEDKKSFIIFSVIGGIGAISMISIPNFWAIGFYALAFGVALFYRFLRNNEKAIKVVHYSFLVACGMVVIFIFFAYLNVSVDGVANAIKGSKLLDRIFNGNRIMYIANPVLQASVKPTNLFGIYHGANYSVGGYVLPDYAVASTSGAFEVELLKEGGLFAFLALLALMIFVFNAFARYLRYSKDKDYVKVILLTFVVGFTLYSTICTEVFPFTHLVDTYQPFSQSLPFYLVLFVIGFIVLPKGKEEIVYAKEEVKKEVKVDPNDDYAFSDVEEEEII